MRNTTTALIAAALIASFGTTAAKAESWGKPCTTAPEAQYLTVDALKAKVEAQGYKVEKGKIAKACGEFYATDKAGAKVEVFVDPTNGNFVGKL